MKVKGFLSGYEVELYSVLRIVAGFLFLWHGSQKLFHIPPMEGMLPHYAIYIGGPIELIGGFLIMIGLWSRWAAFIASGEMAFAYWTVHALHAALPLVNRGELAILYCFLFLYISSKGSGVISVDHLIKKLR
ncbi:MAG: DoxX family protein [Bacteroidales bacterium]